MDQKQRSSEDYVNESTGSKKKSLEFGDDKFLEKFPPHNQGPEGFHSYGTMGEEVEIGMKSPYKALGNKVAYQRELETIPLGPKMMNVAYTSDEVMANCPVTGAPDWYTVAIEILDPEEKGLESKSLKLYLQSFQNEGIFCEAFAERIANDVMEATEASVIRVTVIQKPRGGVSITARAEVYNYEGVG